MTQGSGPGRRAVATACIRIAIAAAAVLVAAVDAGAHANPPGCAHIGAHLVIDILRDTDGTTLPGEHGPGDRFASAPLEPGETVYYQARLTQYDNETCGYEGGTVCIDPPGSTGCTDVTPSDGIPLICGEPTCNPVGFTSFTFPQVAYVVEAADQGGECGQGALTTHGYYRDGTSHYGQFSGDVSGVETDYLLCNELPRPTPTATPPATPTPDPTPKPTTASAVRCKRAIAAASLDYVNAIASSIDACKRHVVGGDGGSLAACAPGNLPAVAEAAQRLRDTIAATCGGSDRRCATTADNDPLAAIDWDSGACPGIAGGDCRNAIVHCGDVADCLACVGETAVESTVDGLLYDRFRAAEFGTGTVANRCQTAITKAGVRAFQSAVGTLGRCWRAKVSAKPGFADTEPCPATDPRTGVARPPASAGDNKTVVAMKKATQKATAAICRACGARGDADRDGRCDAPPGLALGAFADEPFACPDVEVPASAVHPSGVDCGAIGVTDLQSYVDCVRCVVDFDAACAAAAMVGEDAAEGLSYAPECRAAP